MARQVRAVHPRPNLIGRECNEPLGQDGSQRHRGRVGAFAQSTVVSIDNEPAPRLIVESPLPGPLAQGVVVIPYRVENVRILPVAGPAARNLSPRVGHLHITVDDLPWLWADFGQSNSIVLAGMPRGQHKVLIELVDAEGNVFTAQTVTFHSPGKDVRP